MRSIEGLSYNVTKTLRPEGLSYGVRRGNSAQHGDERDYQHRDDNDDGQVSIGQTPRSPGGKIVGHLPAPLGHSGHVVIAQPPDRLVHFAVMDLPGLHR